jgi:hypothetical protein
MVHGSAKMYQCGSKIPWMPSSVSFISFPVSSSWKFRVVVGRRLLFQVIEWNRTYETWMDARAATKSTSENGKMDKHMLLVVS